MTNLRLWQGLVAIGLIGGLSAWTGEEQKLSWIPAFTPSDTTRLAYADGKWVVWTVRDQFGNPRLRAIPFRTRYFRQKLAEPDGSLVFEMRGTYSRNVATVLDDGTLVLAEYSGLVWVLPDGSTASERPAIDGKECRIVQAYPDGLLLQPNKANENAPIYFVPIVKRKLDIAAKIELTDQEGASVNSPPRILRSGNQIAFGRYVFDLKKRERVKLGVDTGSIATAFDGATLVVFNSKGHVAISMADGAEQIVDKPGGRIIGSRVFIVRNRIGYFLDYSNAKDSDALVLKAIPLFEPERGGTELARVPFKGGRVGLFNVDVPHVKTEKGLVVWDGKTWQLVPWLSKGEDDAKAEKGIKALGGQVIRDAKAEGTPIISVNFNHTKVTDAGLKELAGLKTLQTLALGDTKVTDAGLKELADLKSLQYLSLDLTMVTDVGLKNLAGLKSLQALYFYGTKVTHAGMKELAGLKSLQYLDLGSTKVTDAGLKELAGLKTLKELRLNDTTVTDVGLKELASLTTLKELNLGNTKVTDVACATLCPAVDFDLRSDDRPALSPSPRLLGTPSRRRL